MYKFLASISFAIILIVLTTLFVVVGTFLESKTNSHLYAETFTYKNPLFLLLLIGFFVNILFSALRRWPFRFTHIPFLMTHLALLMILAGIIIKNSFGIQGVMKITEGSASHEILLPNSYAIVLEKFDEESPTFLKKEIFEIDSDLFGKKKINNHQKSQLKIHLASFSPHASEQYETWIKGNKTTIHGIPPFKVSHLHDEILKPLQVDYGGKQWNLYAAQTEDDDYLDIIKRIYLKDLHVSIKHQNETIYQGLIETLLDQQEKIKAFLHFNYFDREGFQNPYLSFEFVKDNEIEKIQIPLDGKNCLANQALLRTFASPSFCIDLKRNPTLLLLKNEDTTTLFAFGEHGDVFSHSYPHDTVATYISYNMGFSGYAVKAEIPLRESREKNEQFAREQLLATLNKHPLHNTQIARPLAMFRNACKQATCDFSEQFIQFLFLWKDQQSWFYSKEVPLPKELNQVFENLVWDKKDLIGVYWIKQIFGRFGSTILTGENFIAFLKESEWPLIAPLEEIQRQDMDDSTKVNEILTTFTEQIFSIRDLFPQELPEINPQINAELFSAFLRVYGIHLSNMKQPSREEKLHIEAPLTLLHVNEPKKIKLEENTPRIILEIDNGNISQKVSLVYDRFAQKLKWPILNGEYLVRFQPKIEAIPYKVRLHQARKINYLDTAQPYSYESDVTITDLRDESPIEFTLSMNKVYETWDGYRFYLANISPADEGSVKSIQLIINHDPVKYWLTYPGAILLVFGVISLFWWRRGT